MVNYEVETCVNALMMGIYG